MEALVSGIYVLVAAIVVLSIAILLLHFSSRIPKMPNAKNGLYGIKNKLPSSPQLKGVWWWIKVLVGIFLLILAIYGAWTLLKSQPSQDWGYLLHDSPISSTGTGKNYTEPNKGGDRAFPVEENPDVEIFRGKNKILLRNPGNHTIFMQIPLGVCKKGKCEINARFMGDETQEISMGFELQDIWSSGLDSDHPHINRAFNYTGWKSGFEVSLGTCDIRYPSHNEGNYIVYQESPLVNAYGKTFSPEGRREYEAIWIIKLLPGQEVMIYELYATGG